MSTTHNTDGDPAVDWTDQVRTVARFISDRDLDVISLEGRPNPSLGSDDCNVLVHVTAPDWPAWRDELDEVIAGHDDQPKGCPGSLFHYSVALIAGVRVQVLHITDLETAVAR